MLLGIIKSSIVVVIVILVLERLLRENYFVRIGCVIYVKVIYKKRILIFYFFLWIGLSVFCWVVSLDCVLFGVLKLIGYIYFVSEIYVKGSKIMLSGILISIYFVKFNCMLYVLFIKLIKNVFGGVFIKVDILLMVVV